MSDPTAVRLAILAGSLPRLRAHLDAHPEDLRGWTHESWIALAAGAGHVDIVEDLLKRGLSVDEQGSGDTVSSPLAEAAENLAMIRYLLDHGADPRAPGVMVAAASFGSPETVRLLLDRGADPHLRSGDPPRNAYEQAVRMGRTEIAALLRPASRGFDVRVFLEERLGKIETSPSATSPHGAPFSLMVVDLGDCMACTTFGLHAQPLPGLSFRAEIFVRLPQLWPETGGLGADPTWPIEWLLSIAHACLDGPVLAVWDTVGNGEPPEPLSPDVPFVGSINVPEFEDRAAYDDDGNEVKLISLLALHPSELALGRRDYRLLIKKLRTGGVLTSVTHKDRPSVIEAKRLRR